MMRWRDPVERTCVALPDAAARMAVGATEATRRPLRADDVPRTVGSCRPRGARRSSGGGLRAPVSSRPGGRGDGCVHRRGQCPVQRRVTLGFGQRMQHSDGLLEAPAGRAPPMNRVQVTCQGRENSGAGDPVVPALGASNRPTQGGRVIGCLVGIGHGGEDDRCRAASVDGAGTGQVGREHREPRTTGIGARVVHFPGQSRQRRIRAGRVIAEPAPGEDGDVLHEAGAVLGYQMRTWPEFGKPLALGVLNGPAHGRDHPTQVGERAAHPDDVWGYRQAQRPLPSRASRRPGGMTARRRTGRRNIAAGAAAERHADERDPPNRGPRDRSGPSARRRLPAHPAGVRPPGKAVVTVARTHRPGARAWMDRWSSSSSSS